MTFLRHFLLAVLLLLASTSCSKRREPPVPLGALPEFRLTTDAGAPLSRAAFESGDSVVAFFFTRCPSVCPRLVATLQSVEKDLGRADVRFVLVSVDPEFDTPEVLRNFRAKHSLGPRFTLATGPYEEIARVAEQGFKVGIGGRADASKEHFGISHGSHFVHVGREGKILGYYRGQDPEKVRELTGVLAP